MSSQIEENKIRSIKDYINGIIGNKSTRRIFGCVILASSTFLDLNMNHNEILKYLGKTQRKNSLPIKEEELPQELINNPGIIEDLKLIGVLIPDREFVKTYNLVGKENLKIPPITKKHHKYLKHQYKPSYLIQIVGLTRATGYRGINSLKKMKLKLRTYEGDDENGYYIEIDSESYTLLEEAPDEELNLIFLSLNMNGHDQILELGEMLRKRLLVYTRLELKNLNQIKDLIFLQSGLKDKFDEFDIEKLESVQIHQSKYASIENKPEDETVRELWKKAKDIKFQSSLKRWITLLTEVNDIHQALKEVIKSRKSFDKVFNEKNFDQILLYNTDEEMKDKYNTTLKQYLTRAIRSSQVLQYDKESEIIAAAEIKLTKKITEEEQKEYTELRKYYIKAETR